MKAKVLLLILLAVSVPTIADDNNDRSYCEGYLPMYVLTYCGTSSSWCLNRRVYCPKTSGTFEEGRNDGRKHALLLRRFESRIIEEQRRLLEEKRKQRRIESYESV